jgi:predicted DNA-binding protein (UPF0251 family)
MYTIPIHPRAETHEPHSVSQTEAGRMLGISREYVRRLMQAGRLKSVTYLDTPRILVSSINKLMRDSEEH